MIQCCVGVKSFTSCATKDWGFFFAPDIVLFHVTLLCRRKVIYLQGLQEQLHQAAFVELPHDDSSRRKSLYLRGVLQRVPTPIPLQSKTGLLIILSVFACICLGFMCRGGFGCLLCTDCSSICVALLFMVVFFFC